MSEPRFEDDAAFGKNKECDECGCFIWERVCSNPEPDEPYDVIYAD